MEPKNDEPLLLRRGAWNERTPYVLVSHERKCLRHKLAGETGSTTLDEGVRTLIDDKLRLRKNTTEASMSLVW